MASNAEKERKRLLLLEMAKARREGLLSELQEYHQKKSGSQQLADLYSGPEYDRAYRGGMEAQIAKSDAERRAREGAAAHQQNAFQPSTQAYPDAGGMQMGRGMSQYQVQGLLADNARSMRSRQRAAQQAMAQAQAGAVAREQAGPAMSPGEQASAIQQQQQRAALMAQAQAGAVAREQASPAMSAGEQAWAMQQQQQRAALTAQAQAGAVAREQASPAMSLGEELYRQQPPTPGSTFRGMDNYAQGPTLGGRVESFGHPRVAGSGPMYPNAVPYPEASTPTPTPTPMAAPTPVQELPGESLDKFTNNYLDNVQKRKKLIRGASMLFGVPDRSAAYEAKAIAKYTTLMDSRAARMSIGSQPRTQMEMVSAYLKAGGSLEGLKSLSSVVTYGAKPEEPKQFQFTQDKDGKTWKVTERFDKRTGKITEIARSEVKEKGPLVVLNPGITEGPYAAAMGTRLAKIVTDESGEAASARDSTRKIDQMIAAVQTGGVVTGQLTPMQLSIGRFFESSGIGAAAFGKFWGPTAENLGTSEWFQAVADELGAKKLQMTKGNVTEKEMMLFLGMGPQLSKTPRGNILLLQMMQAMNARVMATHEAANEVNRDIVALADEGKSISGPKAWQMYEEIRDKKINDLDTDFENKAKRGGEWNPIRLNDEDVSEDELTASGKKKVEKGQYFILPDGRMGLEE